MDSRFRYRELQAIRPDWFRNEPDGYEVLTSPEDMDLAESVCLRRLQQEAGFTPSSVSTLRDWVKTGVLAEDPWRLVIRDAVRRPIASTDGESNLGVYLRVNTLLPSGAVAAVMRAGAPEVMFLLVDHHRHALRQFSWEFPRGFAQTGEPSLETAIRQLGEEAGAKDKVVVVDDLGVLHTDGGLTGDSVHVWILRVADFGKVSEFEGIRAAKWVTESELAALIDAGRVTDSFTIAAFGKWMARKMVGGGSAHGAT